MLIEGLQLMVIGMTVVFMFLGLMVLTMYGAASVQALLDRYMPGSVTEAASDEPDDSREDIAVVLAALHSGNYN